MMSKGIVNWLAIVPTRRELFRRVLLLRRERRLPSSLVVCVFVVVVSFCFYFDHYPFIYRLCGLGAEMS